MIDLKKLTGEQLWRQQGKAFKAGNMKMVQEIAKEARTRIAEKNRGNWGKAKRILDKMDFPSKEETGGEVFVGNTHSIGKEKHDLKDYKIRLPDIEGFEALARFNVCPICGKPRTKYLIMFDNEKKVCYQKYFMRHGKEIKEFEEEVHKIFSS